MRWKNTLMGLVLLGTTGLSAATPLQRIAVLDFELNDLAGITPTPEQEWERTASITPLIRDALASKGRYEMIYIDHQEQAKANVGFGYLFDHPDEAARLGKRFGADWIAVGRIHKPSFLFAYLKVHLVNVQSAKLVGDYVVEVKGDARPATNRGAAQLADQIDQTINPQASR
jgi:hypothetical protein